MFFKPLFFYTTLSNHSNFFFLQEGELGRPLNNNEVLGNREGEREGNVEADAANVEEVLYMAKVMGAEKRAFIMNHVFGNDDL